MGDGPTDRGREAPPETVVGLRPLLVFLIATFALVWLAALPLGAASNVLAIVGQPSVVAFVVMALYVGRKGTAGLWRGGTRWRVGIGWYVVALALPGLAAGAGWIARSGFSGTVTQPWLAAVASGLLAGIFEEFGWSGVAFPALQARLGFLLAGITLGVIWGLWHLPSLFASAPVLHQSFSFIPFLLFVIPLRILYGWTYNGTGGSILIAVLFHASSDTWQPVLLGHVVADTAWFVVILVYAVAVVTVLLNRRVSKRQRQSRT